jgi:YHS domain-containing protein
LLKQPAADWKNKELAMKSNVVRVVAVAACLIGTNWAFAQHGEKKAEAASGKAMCPVSGHPADLFVSTKTDAGPVFFCCGDCIKDFEAHQDKYTEAVAAQRKELAKLPRVQVVCPVTGEPCDTKISVDVMDQKIYFASDDAKSKYQADPKKYTAAVANSYTYQTKCPVMDKPIDPKRFVTLTDGSKIYFCCGKCDSKLISNPEKYVDKLAAQGYTFDIKKVKK